MSGGAHIQLEEPLRGHLTSCVGPTDCSLRPLDQVFATKFLKAAKTNLYEEGPTQAAADTARSYAYQMGGQAAIQGMRDALLPSEQAQSAGQVSSLGDLLARWVTVRARWVTRRARWVTVRAHWVAY